MLKSYISRIAAFTHSDGNRWLAGATLSILTGVASALIFVGASDASRPQASSNKAPA